MRLLRRPAIAFLLALAAAGASGQQPNPPPARPGFPVTLAGSGPGAGAVRGGHPAIADLGLSSGRKSIVFGNASGRLFVVNHDGTVAAGFPVTFPSEIVSSPAVGDINNDGAPDIVVGYGSQFAPASPGGIRAYRRDGSLLWSRITGDFDGNGISDAVVSAPAIGDVDGDGLVDVVFTSFDDNVYLVNGATGANKLGWPRAVRDTIWSSPALFDIDGDARLDIIVGVDAHLEGPPYNTPDGGCLHVFRFDGTEVAGFPKCLDQVISSSPAIGDINGDGRAEIVVGTGGFWCGRARRVYAFRCDGTDVPGWPVPVDGEVATAPALADLDGDGVPEVVVTDHYNPACTPSPPPQAVYAFKGNGTRLFRTVPKDFFGQTLSAADPVVADVLGDSRPEILVPTNGEICVLSNAGVQLTDNGTHPPGALSFVTEGSLANASVADFEDDGVVEVVAASGAPFPSYVNTKVFVWNPKPAASVPAWGLFHQNARRSGVVPGTPPCANPALSFFTLTPCRVLDTRDSPGPFGGPALGGLSVRTFTLAGRCGIPSDARAVSANLTIVNPTSAGHLTVFPSGFPVPLASIMNFRGGQVRANNGILGLASGGISVQNGQASGTVDFILDVNGYFR